MPILVTVRANELNPQITQVGFDPNNPGPIEAAVMARLNALPPGPNMGVVAITAVIRPNPPVVQFQLLPDTLDANRVKAALR